jgi:hypothetical protein
MKNETEADKKLKDACCAHVSKESDSNEFSKIA